MKWPWRPNNYKTPREDAFEGLSKVQVYKAAYDDALNELMEYISLAWNYGDRELTVDSLLAAWDKNKKEEPK